MSIPQWLKKKKIKAIILRWEEGMRFVLRHMNTKDIGRRAMYLLGASGIAVVIGVVLFVCIEPSKDGGFPDVLKVAITGLPIAFVLWVFRTHDTTENLFSNAFYKGIELLYGEDTVHSGVDLLIGLSKNETQIFDERIKNAFIQLLIRYKFNQDAPEHMRPQYAQHIIAWFHERGYLSEALRAIQANRACLNGQRIDMSIPHVNKAFQAILSTEGNQKDRAILIPLLGTQVDLFYGGDPIPIGMTEAHWADFPGVWASLEKKFEA